MGDLDEANERRGFSTRAIHAGQDPDPTTGAVVTPLSLSTTFAQEGVGGHKGFEYSRSGNPTRSALEAQVAALEEAHHGLAFASGLAAEDNILRLLRPGQRILLGNDAYGGTFRLISKVWSPLGFPWTAVDLTDLDALRADWPDDVGLVWLETPTNPLLTCFDIEAISEISHNRGAIVVVDNTFATPYLQQPLTLGADIVVHSATKYLGGHSDVVGGFVAVNDDDLGERLRFTQNAAGAVPAPFDCYLVLRGVKTLAVRMERHESSGRAIAEYLNKHAKVKRLLYPGLPDHPGHEVQSRQATGYGALITFDLGSYAAAKTLLDNLEVMSLAESLGGVETLISHPASMTHASVPLEKREELGMTDGVVRVSVGLEDLEDLVADLESALAKI